MAVRGTGLAAAMSGAADVCASLWRRCCWRELTGPLAPALVCAPMSSFSACAVGISLKTQFLYALVFVCRYVDLFTNFASMYNW